jgi:hypothetical protein
MRCAACQIEYEIELAYAERDEDADTDAITARWMGEYVASQSSVEREPVRQQQKTRRGTRK